ncbi:MAG TPA: threonine synthase, partial [Myxococcaceae bacterium]
MSTTGSGFRAEYACSEGCGFRASLWEVIYRCPKCDALLEVAHDLEALRSVPAAEWKRRFESRYGGSRLPN